MNFKTFAAGALALAAVGIVIQQLSGNVPDYPIIAPGLLILLAAAAVTILPGRWTPSAAVLAGLFISVGLFAADQSSRLAEPETAGDTVGLWVQLVAAVVAVICAVLAIARPGKATPARSVSL